MLVRTSPLAFTLRSKGEIKPGQTSYSPHERLLWELIPKDGQPIEVTDLMDRFFQDNNPRGGFPFNGRTIVNGLINSLIRKVQFNSEPFVVRRSPRAGPKGSQVWIEPLTTKKRKRFA